MTHCPGGCIVPEERIVGRCGSRSEAGRLLQLELIDLLEHSLKVLAGTQKLLHNSWRSWEQRGEKGAVEQSTLELEMQL